jgi:hypothetical protein
MGESRPPHEQNEYSELALPVGRPVTGLRHRSGKQLRSLQPLLAPRQMSGWVWVNHQRHSSKLLLDGFLEPDGDRVTCRRRTRLEGASVEAVPAPTDRADTT